MHKRNNFQHQQFGFQFVHKESQTPWTNNHHSPMREPLNLARAPLLHFPILTKHNQLITQDQTPKVNILLHLCPSSLLMLQILLELCLYC